MSFEVSGIDPMRGQQPVSTGRATRATAPAGDFADAVYRATSDRFDAIPASPPPELHSEMLVAQRAIEELRARGRELHFEMVEGRVRIEMRDLDGNVLKEIPGTQALEIAAGRIPE